MSNSHTRNNHSRNTFDCEHKILVMKAVVTFLQMFFAPTFVNRIIATILLIAGVPVKEIAQLLGVGHTSVYDLRKAIMASSTVEEIMGLFQMKSGCGRKSKTGNVLNSIINEIETGTYTSLRDIQDMLRNIYGITLSIASTQRLMINMGIKRLKAASFPENAVPEKQKEYFENTLFPMMQDALDDKMHLLFMDGAHFVMGCDFLGYIYGSKRRFVRSHSGRQRYNVLGAINFVTKKVHTVTNTDYINATEVMKIMREVVAFYGPDKPIRIVLDNARYQKCEVVKALKMELQKEYDFDLVYLPSYSPNLNLIERLWRYVKTKVKASYTKDFSSFCSNIDSIIATTDNSAKSEIDSLIGEKVQLYDSLVPVDAHTFVMPKKEKKDAQSA